MYIRHPRGPTTITQWTMNSNESYRHIAHRTVINRCMCHLISSASPIHW